MLSKINRKFYRVKAGQTAAQIAEYFCVAPRLLIKENGLLEEPKAGQILVISSQKGNAYTVRAGEDKALLCGSEKDFERLNGTSVFYIGMSVRI
jgi:hypothetical protein